MRRTRPYGRRARVSRPLYEAKVDTNSDLFDETVDELVDFIYDELDEGEQVDLWNEYLSKDKRNARGESRIYSMYDLPELYPDPIDALKFVYDDMKHRSFNPNDDYFFVSTDGKTLEGSEDFIDDVADFGQVASYILETGKTLGLSGIKDFIDRVR